MSELLAQLVRALLPVVCRAERSRFQAPLCLSTLYQYIPPCTLCQVSPLFLLSAVMEMRRIGLKTLANSFVKAKKHIVKFIDIGDSIT